ncbi:dUTP diphosphatase [Candidatus Gracilibacteria bacterium]|nr:dUTP diphosphatase [Candidatus Gracilibacteria bacterium]
MKLFIKKLHKDAKLPTRAHHDDAGIDIYAHGTHIVEPNQTLAIPTGVSMELEKGYVSLVWDKSGIALKGIKTVGGVIDAGYRGEYKIMIHNLSDISYIFSNGDKVAQILIQKVEFPELVEVNELKDSTRGVGGFGSTGK